MVLLFFFLFICEILSPVCPPKIPLKNLHIDIQYFMQQKYHLRGANKHFASENKKFILNIPITRGNLSFFDRFPRVCAANRCNQWGNINSPLYILGVVCKVGTLSSLVPGEPTNLFATQHNSQTLYHWLLCTFYCLLCRIR